MPLTKEQYEQLVLKGKVPKDSKGIQHNADCIVKCADCDIISCSELGAMVGSEFTNVRLCEHCLEDICEDCWANHLLQIHQIKEETE